ncbi:hypothetical protein MJO28_011906 [Puccinia striiformis f. sp. tritici]|nr:hypothetical protein Pst134EA_021479 [Puccinia striiformis f. sp. tritici]KAH9457604.1 hypothetical protein Pst134EA_021479 [Puccinia striiformis f. sp. tritici]KAI7944378.1 hypothetical protein MJO28_011906 [Puccinia striiformis f. sp. tritici]
MRVAGEVLDKNGQEEFIPTTIHPTQLTKQPQQLLQMTSVNPSYTHPPSGPTVTYDPAADIIPVEQNDIIRLKIFVPLATLTAMFSNLVCALLIDPSMGDINDRYYTLLTPSKILIGFYWMVIFACQFGMAFMVVCTSNQRYRTEETKQTFVHAIGMTYVVALFGFALWPIFWAAELFVVSTVLLFVVFLLMTYTLHSIWKHSPPSFTSKPFSFMFIYIPVQLFQTVLFTVDLPQSILISLKWFRSPIDDTWERHFSTHAWIIFGIVLLIGLSNAFTVYRAKDLIRMLAVVYLSIALLINSKGTLQKVADAPQVITALIAAAAGCVVCFIASFVDFGSGRNRIILPDEDEREEQLLRR